MKYIKFTIFLILMSFQCFAQNIYDIADIPESLKKSTHAVIRNEKTVFEIFDTNKATLTIDYAITILNSNGAQHANLAVPYDKFSKVKSIRGEVYDSNGDQVKRIKQDDIFDVSIIQGFAFYDDNRVKVADPDYKVYPFTVHYSYEIDFNGLLSYPSWIVHKGYNVGIEKSTFDVIVTNPTTTDTPEGAAPFRYLELNGMENTLTTSVRGSKKIHHWEVNQIEGIIKEPFSPNINEFSPAIRLAPVDFKIAGYEGNFSSWNEFGKWISLLNRDRNNLSEASKSKVTSLIGQEKDDLEKVRILYEYLQSNTRYVSIQLGIGGWQPFEADFVDQKGYGDCKALTNYMMSMLETVDIKSNYVLVKAGADQQNLLSNFPSNQFNHAFLMVPMDNDTVWLECTSQYIPFDYLGSFTDDRDVLIIKEDGADLIHTPASSAEDNVRKREVTVTLNKNGDANVQLSTSYKGQYYSRMLGRLISDQARKKDLLYQDISLPSFTIEGFSYREQKSNKPEIEEKVVIKAPKYGKQLGERLAVKLNMLSALADVPQKDHDRKFDIEISRPFREHDIIKYKLPTGFSAQYKPEGKRINSKFGDYSFNVNVENNHIIYERTFEMKKNRYSPDDYQEFVSFLNKVKKLDQEKLLLVGGT